ncbi:hypothetical protein [Methanobrevibacter olleyae]|uniref:Phage tail sheath protein n=1 Tax=Methanobrevibacter olleyae TaxID=294671 RepID=A0A126R1P9_METOL|nr:hypothetical protein [Methanobrevibacter olleyae]AMK16323.1 hypothetical protein YLM1_1768 [Methanobrevibacter olleyae]
MVNIEPRVEVYKTQSITSPGYGNAGKVALVGAFPSNTFKLDLFTSLDEAQKAVLGEYKLPNDNSVENAGKTVVPETFTSFYCLEYIFNSTPQANGAESVVLVNTNYGKESLVESSTNEDIGTAFQLLAEEDFDILTFAETINLAVEEGGNYILNPVLQTIKSFVNNQFLNQKPFGVISGFDISNCTNSILEAFQNLFSDKGIYKAVTTPVRLSGEPASLNMAQSGCWHSAFTAGRAVNKSETAKIYEGLIGENSKDLYPTTETINWDTLLQNGLHTTKYRNRRLSTIQCLSNITPMGYDMKVERVFNYMIKRLTLVNVLGDDNVKITHDYIRGLFEYEKNTAIKNNYITDMIYNLVTIDAETVQTELEIYIPEIVRVIKLNANFKITAYTEEA